MAIELPSEVAKLLNFIGIPWINVNEDKVREFATHVRQFGSDVSDAHGAAASTLTQLGSGYQGAAYEALMRMWGDKSTSHINDLVEGCDVLATALDAGADFIEAQKIACIGELIGMAVAFFADEAASAVTFGLAELALPAIELGARKLVEFTEQQLEQYVIGEITNAALQPLISKIASLVEGLVFGGGDGAGAVGSSYEVDFGQLSTQAAAMKGHADTIRSSVTSFTSNVQGLDFTS
jgi:uncharacterized protein YukE